MGDNDGDLQVKGRRVVVVLGLGYRRCCYSNWGTPGKYSSQLGTDATGALGATHAQRSSDRVAVYLQDSIEAAKSERETRMAAAAAILLRFPSSFFRVMTSLPAPFYGAKGKGTGGGAKKKRMKIDKSNASYAKHGQNSANFRSGACISDSILRRSTFAYGIGHKLYIYIFVCIIDDTARYANSMRFACAVREYGPTAY